MRKRNLIKEVKILYNDANLLRYRNPYKWYNWRSVRDFFRWLWRLPKRIYQRAKYGWCPYDLWDLDHYIYNLMATAMRYFAEAGMTVPTSYVEKYGGDKHFDEAAEAWRADILRIADNFEQIHFYERDGWIEDFDEFINLPKEEKKVRYQCANEAYEKMVAETFNWLAENMRHLWW